MRRTAEQLAKADQELERLQSILHDAITALMHHFDRVVELSDGQRDLAREILAGSLAADDETRRMVDGFEENIGEQLNGALTALQFQDLAWQLINHVRERLQALDAGAPAEEAGVARTGVHPVARGDERTFGPIGQEKVRSGAVELF